MATLNNEYYLNEIKSNGISYVIYLYNKDKDYISKLIFEKKIPYELDVLNSILKYKKTGGIFVDIGANIGNHSLFIYAHTKCDIVAFEPNTVLYEAFNKSIHENNIKNIQLYCCALGKEYSLAKFATINEYNTGGQSLTTGDGTIEVKKLDDFNIKNVDIIKIDVEGMEMDVLEGAINTIKNNKPIVYVECATDSSFHDVFNFFININYIYVDTLGGTPTHIFAHIKDIDMVKDNIISSYSNLIYKNQKKNLPTNINTTQTKDEIKKSKVFIWGSSVSRECVNYSLSSFDIVACHVRSSCASAMSKPVPLSGVNLDAVSSTFKQQTIINDFQKKLLVDLETTEFDVLLIDFIDERFALKIYEEGRIVTASAELQETGSVTLDNSLVYVGDEKRFSLWHEAWDKFMDFCDRHGIRDKIVLNCVYWADHMENGEPVSHVTQNYIARNNAFLDRIYEVVKEDIPESRCICYSDGLIVANSKHRWGISPFHYIDDVYEYSILKLKNIIFHCSNDRIISEKIVNFPEFCKTRNPSSAVKEIAKIVTPDKTIFDESISDYSLDSISNLKRGRLRVFYKGVVFEGLFEPCESEYLCVSLSSAGMRKVYPFFTRWSWARLFSCNFLCIEDPMYDEHNTHYPLWYYGTNNINYLDLLIDIVLKVAEKLSIDKAKIVFLGSSAGGHGALYCSAKIQGSIALAMAPQLRLSVYPGNKYLKNIVDLTTSDDRNDLFWITKNTKSTYAISYNIADPHDYHYQFLPFAKKIGYEPKFGISTYNNMIFWLYYANVKNPHNVVLSSFHTLLLYFLAKKHASGDDISYIDNFSVLLNEDIRTINTYKEKYDSFIAKNS